MTYAGDGKKTPHKGYGAKSQEAPSLHSSVTSIQTSNIDLPYILPLETRKSVRILLYKVMPIVGN